MSEQVYVFQAAFLCQNCGEKAQRDIQADYPDIDPLTLDTDSYPDGPYREGGGESDSPQHCDWCQKFLENPLTDDGYLYTKDLIIRDIHEGRLDSIAVTVWQRFYDIQVAV